MSDITRPVNDDAGALAALQALNHLDDLRRERDSLRITLAETERERDYWKAQSQSLQDLLRQVKLERDTYQSLSIQIATEMSIAETVLSTAFDRVRQIALKPTTEAEVAAEPEMENRAPQAPETVPSVEAPIPEFLRQPGATLHMKEEK